MTKTRHSQYHTCPYCGAHLDPGEKCDCEGAKSARHRAAAIYAAAANEKGFPDSDDADMADWQLYSTLRCLQTIWRLGGIDQPELRDLRNRAMLAWQAARLRNRRLYQQLEMCENFTVAHKQP